MSIWPCRVRTARWILTLRANGSEAIESAEVGLFDRAGERITIESMKDTTALLLSAEPIDEPIFGAVV